VKRLAVIGMGYVGIPAAALFADTGEYVVTGIQRRSTRSGWKIDFLNTGKSPFPDSEPGMSDLLRRVIKEKKTFSVTDDFQVLEEMDVILIDVQTPVDENHIPQYESLKEVSSLTGRLMKQGVLICIESTVAPGTTQNVVKPILEEESGMNAGKDFSLAFSYERVMVGRLLHNIQNYPRVVGGFTEKCANRAVSLYRQIVQAPVVSTNCLTAEVSKTVENAYRDVNIAFANEVALLCESLGVSVYKVRELVNNLPDDPSNPAANPVRNMHMPGAGVGGHCLPKDSWLLKYGMDKYGKSSVELKIIIGSRKVNDEMPIHMANLVVRTLQEAGVAVSDARIVLFGYAFIGDSDDTRNTPALPLIEELYKCGIKTIIVHDPFVRAEEVPGIIRDIYTAAEEADCICIVTGHSIYRQIDLDIIRNSMRTPILIDGRNILPRAYTGVTIVKIGDN
jgi:UDP-N-acetyl-D-mannosaminuronic acid dehydrogenase